ncbi:MAG TPA: hypothetical protein VNA20_16245 [Frankiaceae bacterium]|nr:hypothetical protein [Frankiaceae bacterium]
MLAELARGPLQTIYGEWEHILYWDGTQQLIAMVYGAVPQREAVPCRVHSSCITAHVFLSTECDCREQLDLAMRYIRDTGHGVVVWLDHEGRGNGMMAHIASQSLKRSGLSQSKAYEELSYPRDARRYETAAEVLRALSVKSIRVLTNNPLKVEALRAAGLPIVVGDERVMIEPTNDLLRKQYQDKRDDDNHFFGEDI